MRYKVHVRPEAEKDIEETAFWYENQSKGLGGDFLDELLSVRELIVENPELCPKIFRQTRRAIMKRFPFGVYYRIEDSFIVIIAVMHGSRHPNRWQSRG